MNEVVNVPNPEMERMAGLKQITLVCYILYALSWLTGITGIVAIIINYIKREDVQGTLYESHFTWQIRTFWWGLLWGVIGFITTFVLVGFLILAVAAIWSIYRLVKGFLNWSEGKPMPV